MTFESLTDQFPVVLRGHNWYSISDIKNLVSVVGMHMYSSVSRNK
jgi:hypothetical protein